MFSVIYSVLSCRGRKRKGGGKNLVIHILADGKEPLSVDDCWKLSSRGQDCEREGTAVLGISEWVAVRNGSMFFKFPFFF